MRMVIAHEVGHALGFPHNMAASFSYSVESLRDGDFTQKYGLAASLMDYTRYNYVAQPGDKNIRFIRQMGPYDHYATNWGYRVILSATSTEDEHATLNKWILDKADDPKYKFGRQSSRFDPSSQTECVGDDPIKASTYGLKNLKYVAANLPEWTSSKTNNYNDLEELYGELQGVWSRYIGHVVTNIGGIYENLKTPSQEGVVYTHVDEATQKASMKWIQANAFKTPKWMVDKNILQNIDHAGYFERFRRLQSRHLNSLLSFDRIGRLIDAETINDDVYYSSLEMLRELRTGLWSEIRNNTRVDIFRRDLQRAYIERMVFLMTNEARRSFNRPGFESTLTYNVSQSDVHALVRGELKELRRRLRIARSNVSDTLTRYHYEDCIARIDALFDTGK